MNKKQQKRKEKHYKKTEYSKIDMAADTDPKKINKEVIAWEWFPNPFHLIKSCFEAVCTTNNACADICV